MQNIPVSKAHYLRKEPSEGKKCKSRKYGKNKHGRLKALSNKNRRGSKVALGG